jgi:copper homeostasis protein
MPLDRKLEICCYSLESALLAGKSGANRIELCDNYPEAGTTPSYGTIEVAVQKLSIPVNVIVRPRGGDFLYSDNEYESIKNDIAAIKAMEANGIVVGFLKANGDIDLKRTIEIVNIAKPLEVTFHRAFDMCRSPLEALEQLKKAGVNRVLTSGAKMKAVDGIDMISELVKRAGGKIVIMPGSGINENNLTELVKRTGAYEYHSSAKKFISSKMTYFNKFIHMGGDASVNEYSVVSVDAAAIKKMIGILNNY